MQYLTSSATTTNPSGGSGASRGKAVGKVNLVSGEQERASSGKVQVPKLHLNETSIKY